MIRSREAAGVRGVLTIGAAAAAALLAAACGGNVTVDRATNATTGAGGGTGTSTTTTGSTTTTTGSTTTPSTTSTTGTGGGPPSCAVTHEAMSFVLDVDSDGAFGCNAAQPGQDQEITVQGRVTEAGPAAFVLDTCPPNMDCMPSYARVTFDGSSPGFPVPTGAFVRVHLKVEFPWGCGQKLLVTNLPEWGGETNPVQVDPITWLAASDGLASTFDEAPFTVEAVPLNCGLEMGDAFLFRFRLRDPASGDPGVDVPMGANASWSPQQKAPWESWLVRNLRSYESGAADDYWNWSYWLVQEPTFD